MQGQVTAVAPAGRPALHSRNLGSLLRALIVLGVPGAAAAESILYVDMSASDVVHDGSSWCSAFVDLQLALGAANAPGAAVSEVRIAKGVYRPAAHWWEPNATFALKSGLTISGGYAGCGALDPDARDPAAYSTILDGDLNNDDDCMGTGCSLTLNSYHVVTADGCDRTAILDGVTISRGRARRYPFPTESGAGVLMTHASPTLRNCRIHKNTVVQLGGGVYNDGGNPLFENCIFEINGADKGGAIYNIRGTPTFIQCRFIENSATDGAGVYNQAVSPAFTSCVFEGNHATGSGGGIFNVESSSPVLTGCTFTANTAGAGGGVYNIHGSHPILSDCVFAENSAQGAGLWSRYGSHPTLVGCILERNLGEALLCQEGVVHVANCRFLRNITENEYRRGAAISGGNITLDVVGSDFFENSAGDEGGAMHLFDSSMRLTRCSFRGNRTNQAGGAIDLLSTAAEITNCNIDHNSAVWGGGGLSATGGTVRMANSTITDNWLTGTIFSEMGAGVHGRGAILDLINCTVVGNRSPESGGGIHIDSAGRLTLVNSILWGNHLDQINFPSSLGQIVVEHSNVRAGWVGKGNIQTDPLFVDANNGDYRLAANSPCIDGGSTADLIPDTADLDADGDLTEPLSLDFADQPRVLNGRVDIGAYEFLPDCNGNQIPDTVDITTKVSVDCTENLTPDECEPDCDENGHADSCDLAQGKAFDCTGNQVPDACEPDCNDNHVADSCDVLSGLSMDCTGNEIPDECEPDCNGSGIADRCDIHAGTSEDINGDAIPDECQFEDRKRLYVNLSARGMNDGSDWVNALTDLRSALAIARRYGAVSEIWVAAGFYRPSLPPGPLDAAFELVDGVRVFGGFGGWETSLEDRNLTANPTTISGDLLQNDEPPIIYEYDNIRFPISCVNCSAATVLDGFTITAGSLQIAGGSSSIMNCRFVDSIWRQTSGAAVSIGNSDPLFVRCEFSRNHAEFFGGAVLAADASPTFLSCAFFGNSSDANGGAVYLYNSTGTFLNCAFSGNSSNGNGGAIANNGGPLSLVNCTLSRNRAVVEGGGVFAGTSVTVSNSVFWANMAYVNKGPSAQLTTSRPPRITYSCIEGLAVGSGGPGNINTDPLFLDADGADDVAGTMDDDLRLSAGSPCIDAGDTHALSSDFADLDNDGNLEERTSLDLAGNARTLDDPATPDDGPPSALVVDMGSYEYYTDCNVNGIVDIDDIDQGLSPDCNQNATPDECDRPADLSGDGAVSLLDFERFFECLTAPCASDSCEEALFDESCCQLADVDNDGDVDLVDIGFFQTSYSAP